MHNLRVFHFFISIFKYLFHYSLIIHFDSFSLSLSGYLHFAAHFSDCLLLKCTIDCCNCMTDKMLKLSRKKTSSKLSWEILVFWMIYCFITHSFCTNFQSFRLHPNRKISTCFDVMRILVTNFQSEAVCPGDTHAWLATSEFHNLHTQARHIVYSFEFGFMLEVSHFHFPMPLFCIVTSPNFIIRSTRATLFDFQISAIICKSIL